MTTEIRIPGLSAGMSEGTLVEWHVEHGSAVKAGQILYTVESEKSAQDIESPVDGVLNQIGKMGEAYPVGELIATIS